MSTTDTPASPRADLIIREHKAELVSVLPSHLVEKGDGWINSAVAAVRRNRDLWAAANNNPGSLMNALSEAARLGLQPGSEEYYLTPRKVKGSMEVLGITGYQGEIELIYRAGAVSSVIAEVVYSGDRFDYQPGRHDRPVHEIDWDAPDRGDLRLVYAYAVMKDGATSKVVVLNKAAVEKAKAVSQGSDSEYSPWRRWPEAMWLKTAVHQLAKWVPTSAEYIREQLRAVRDVASEAPHLPAPINLGNATVVEDDVVDAEVVDEPTTPAAAPVFPVEDPPFDDAAWLGGAPVETGKAGRR